MRLRYVVLTVIVVILLAVRLALPPIILNGVNRKLDSLPEGHGHVGGVRLALARGVIVFDDVRLKRDDGALSARIATVDVGLIGSFLLHGECVGQIRMRNPTVTVELRDRGRSSLRLSHPPSGAVTVGKSGRNLSDTLRQVLPFRVDRFDVIGGVVVWHRLPPNPTGIAPAVPSDAADVSLVTDLRVSLTDMAAVANDPTALPSSGDVTAKLAGTSDAHLSLHFDPQAAPPRFTMALHVHPLDLTVVRPLLESQMGVTVKRGTLALDAEATAAEGVFHGSVKPVIANLSVQNRGGGGTSRAGKDTVSIDVGSIVIGDSSPGGGPAAIPLAGRFAATGVDVWEGIAFVVRDAVAQAFSSGFNAGFQ